MAWKLRGEYLENCNCDILCPCITSSPMGSNLPIARSVIGRYNDPDYGFSFDNTGKNGHFREFAWQA